jgi:peptide/nickel transport system permease protein
MAAAENVIAPRIAVPAGRATIWRRVRDLLEILFRSKTALVGLALVGVWVLLAIFADDCVIQPACWVQSAGYEPQPWLARYSATEQFSGEQLLGPTAKHWLGTDQFSRDLWARLVYGGRIILTLAPISVLVALTIGGTLGVVSGYYGGTLDEIVMRTLDGLMAFPSIILYLVIIAALGASPVNVVLAITLAGMPGIARLVRSLTLDIKTRDFIAAAQTRGESSWYIMLVEILPNASGPIIVDAMLRMGYSVFAISALGFLGLGLPPPTPDWGSIMNVGRKFVMAGQPWGAIWPAAATAMVVVGLNLMADGLSHEMQRYR